MTYEKRWSLHLLRQSWHHPLLRHCPHPQKHIFPFPLMLPQIIVPQPCGPVSSWLYPFDRRQNRGPERRGHRGVVPEARPKTGLLTRGAALPPRMAFPGFPVCPNIPIPWDPALPLRQYPKLPKAKAESSASPSTLEPRMKQAAH